MIELSNIRSIRVLIVPLNWGLGHAARLIPVIKEFILSGAEVVIGGSPQHLTFFQQELGPLETVSLPYLRIQLSRNRSQIGPIALQLPLILSYFIREHIALKRIVKARKIDLVISDNCYGLWNRSVPCIFITHQLFVEIPRHIKFLSGAINRTNRWFISKYDACWIPDVEAHGGFAGKLSHMSYAGIKTSYLGVLSRFQYKALHSIQPASDDRKKLLILISGPEKQRTVFEKIIRQQIENLPTNFSYDIIRGLPGHNEKLPNSWHNHFPSGHLEKMILDADYIICRAGYSTIMDLIALGRTALLVPTPGQSEQEYLAEYLSSKGYFPALKQDGFNLLTAIKRLGQTGKSIPFENEANSGRLWQAIHELLNQMTV